MVSSASVYLARLACLRAHLQARGLAALWIPSSDPHQSEYLPERWRGRAWASGFTGSVGHLLVAMERAALLVDGRYALQAGAELAGTGIEVVPTANPRATDAAVLDWLLAQLPAGAAVAVDGEVLALAAARQLWQGLAKADMTLHWQQDLLDAVWAERPALPSMPLHEHPRPEAGAARVDKLAALRQRMAALGAHCHLSSALDEIAWLLNLRGADVPFNPVFLAHLLVDGDGCRLFVGPQRLPAALRGQLASEGIELQDYAAIGGALAALVPGTQLLLDPARVSLALIERLSAGVQQLHAPNPLQLMKSPREPAQAEQLRAAMVQDGVALCEFYAELGPALAAGAVSELDLHARVSACRARRPGFRGPSFDTIAGFGPHAAMPHYVPTPAQALPLTGRGLLLIDSGGHYLGGTTDITRVWPLGGPPSPAQRRDYTLVLKGMIALSRVRFPRGTLAPMLDAVARLPLWAEGLDYGHGTGHGVGHYLNVHEGPQLFSQALPQPETALLPGMVISVEPGLYRQGQWGIRLENLVLCVPAGSTEFGEFLAFETLSLCPFDTQCLEPSLLHADELAWLDDYHATVRRRLGPLLEGAALAWLHAHTEPVKR